ncbi:MAG: hypothetical protein HOO19_13995 [Rhodospirillaceae bacterium]|jgi:hypothetical protein|nr:hypothetical protein [Rhodospirillaceae bacterium]MBT3887157.1 hypothetical protein [Rhodospirillaceae bacterium]MBT4115513.1 hypothetical protein [Rhodospirillaceae bacterium]MBT4673536.1 hypothetical protein [Rhodospirillaceae bacterium]MBT4750441.1 hypothetical protein [Rhodospirillaceae bacterium]
MAHVLFVVEAALSRRNFERLGVACMVERDNRVTVVDVADVTMASITHNRDHYGSYEGFEILVARSPKDLWEFLKTISHVDLIFCYLGGGNVTADNYSAHKFIARLNAPYLIVFSNAFPGWQRYRGEAGAFWTRIRDIAGRLGEIRLLNSIIARLPPRLLGVRAPRFLVVGGDSCAGFGTLVDPSTEYIRAHAMDFESYLEVEAAEYSETETAVFIDEFLPFHPDLSMMGVGAPMEAEPYFACLRALFDRIEDELGLRVVIAACPHADYDKREDDFFGGREVIFSKTAELVAKSRMVIAHRSTAINFAVLFRKPVMITATRETYEHNSQTPFLDAVAGSLGQTIQFFNQAGDVDLASSYEMDEGIYQQFVEDYIKSKISPSAPFWDLVVNHVNDSGVAAI